MVIVVRLATYLTPSLATLVFLHKLLQLLDEGLTAELLHLVMAGVADRGATPIAPLALFDVVLDLDHATAVLTFHSVELVTDGPLELSHMPL